MRNQPWGTCGFEARGRKDHDVLMENGPRALGSTLDNHTAVCFMTSGSCKGCGEVSLCHQKKLWWGNVPTLRSFEVWYMG
ncbi:hypothetical protein GPU96_11g20700 [Encephalitozoon hellem]|uniref:Uncharacterized protein n=1 Tax=Encephalitozoon hellem TaxID=27973 RepID=A0A9Q9CDW7_ENCHE|nr:hypothetical protein GPU96_06g12140 [Encephalitozoon hellem]UTX43462.1 hypothetical protein GPU96_07g12190 [Encephalitozoon hellem]UTX43892.1 hypothetical protein GPU96_08g16680 [Encephalitozoon hellem]UTX44073.1 hypothetical protein GPU96_09g18550 [Encephalitozoon hellem]UTX44274.1 hypothetical protein GPU96_11g20700 [Encephalitozoon hellem]